MATAETIAALLEAWLIRDSAADRTIGPAPILSGQEAGPIEGNPYDTGTPLENCEVSPVLSVRVAVMSGYVPVTVVVVVKVKLCVPVLVGVTVSEPR
jgi:hypothetical protein